jgi:hypothetical protein
VKLKQIAAFEIAQHVPRIVYKPGYVYGVPAAKNSLLAVPELADLQPPWSTLLAGERRPRLPQ